MIAPKRLRRFLFNKALEQLPQSIQSHMLEDEALRARFDVEMEASLTLGQDVGRFHRSVLFKAIRKAYARRGAIANLTDLEGTAWHMGIEEQPDGAHAVLRREKRGVILRSFSVLDGDRARRLAGFRQEAQTVNLPTDAVERWTRLLKRRALNDEEASDFERDLSATPVRRAAAISDDIEAGHSKLSNIVPPELVYYDRLIGKQTGTTRIEDYSRTVVPPLVAQLVEWDPFEGAKLALLLAGHSRIMHAIDDATLSKIDMPRLAIWGRDNGDLLSQLGLIEIGAPLIAQDPTLDPILADIARQLLAEDPDREDGRLHLLSSVFMLVDGELSRARTFGAAPPFFRRLASLAQTALISREIVGRVETGRFARWCTAERAYQFYCQSLIDLRIEPRWIPDLASAKQLQNEILGRLATVPSVHDGTLPPGKLRTLLQSDDGTNFTPPSIAAFWPGPLEGAETPDPKPLPEIISVLISESLESPGLDPRSFFALINARGFTIDTPYIDRAIEALRGAKYRIQDDDADALTFIYFGLSAVAAAERRPDLADEIRILLRRGRHEHATPISPINELRIAITAAAAHRDEAAWASFVGDWALELALGDISRRDAEEMLIELNLLVRFAPALAATTARAKAAVQARAAI